MQLKEGHMDKLESQFRCEGCGKVLTVARDGQRAIDSHRDIHGLVVNTGPDLTPSGQTTVTVYRVQIRNQQNEWHDAGETRRTPGEAVTALYEVVAVLQQHEITRYTHARIQMEERTLSQLGSEVAI